MQALTRLRCAILFVWLSFASTFVASNIFDQPLPIEVFTYLKTTAVPGSTLAMYAAILLLLLSSVALWLRNQWGRIVLLTALPMILLADYMAGTNAEYKWTSVFGVLYPLSLGMLIGVVFTHPVSQLFSKNLQITTTSFKVLLLATLAALIMALGCADEHLPVILSNFNATSSDTTAYLIMCVLDIALVFLSLITLLFYVSPSKYLLIPALILYLPSSFAMDAGTGLYHAINFLHSVLISCVFVAAFSESVQITKQNINTFCELPVFEVLKTAWPKLSGSKSTFFMTVFIYVLIYLFDKIIMFIDFHLPVDSFITPLLKIAIGLTLMATSLAGILYGLLLGCMLIFLGYQQSLGNVISMTMLREKFKFRFYIKALGLLLIKITIVLLMWLLLVLPTILKHLMPDIANDSIFKLFTTCIYIITFPTAIYVLYRIYFAESVLVSKNISPWAAICMSWKITKNNVWRLIWLTLLNLLIILISILPLGIGLLWSIPYLYICKGVAYRKLARMA